eukprot:7314992-Alexandrium_andersonii.AAC.1
MTLARGGPCPHDLRRPVNPAPLASPSRLQGAAVLSVMRRAASREGLPPARHPGPPTGASGARRRG